VAVAARPFFRRGAVMGVAGDEEEEGDVEIPFLAGNSLPEYVDGDGDPGVPDFVLRRRRFLFLSRAPLSVWILCRDDDDIDDDTLFSSGGALFLVEEEADEAMED